MAVTYGKVPTRLRRVACLDAYDPYETSGARLKSSTMSVSS